MAGHLELVTPSIEIAAGTVEEAVVRVRNDGDGIEAFQLEVTGEAAPWARVEPKHLAVAAGETAEARIVFDAPPAMLSGAGTFAYRVRLSWAGSIQGAAADGVIEMGGHPEVAATLRQSTRGLRGATAYVDLRNDGTAPARVTVGGDADALDLRAEPESLVIDGGMADSVRLRLRPHRLPILRSRVLGYRVVVEPLQSAPITLAGEVEARPLMASLAPLLVVVLLAAGLLAVTIAGGGDGAGDTALGAGGTVPPTVATAVPTTTAATTTTTSTPEERVEEGVVAVPVEDRRIAFQTARDGNFEIYTVAADGTGAINLTNHPGHDAEPAWSPDGHKLAFDSDRDEGPGLFEIYIMNGDGTGVVRLTNSPGPDGYPSWSPDGTHIAFVSFRDGNSEIYVTPVDGSGEARRLTRHPGDDVRPAWSPDGATILFASNRTGNYEIWSMEASTGAGLTRLTDSPGTDMNPAWSPDGARIAFDSTRDGDRELYVMNADGSSVTRLTESPGGDVWPAWSADGAALAFVSNRDGDEEIYVVDIVSGVSTAPPRRLTTSAGTDSEPAW